MHFLVAILILGAISLVFFFTTMNKPLQATPDEALARGKQLLEVLEPGNQQDLEMAWAILQTSPDLRLVNQHGQTALHLAVATNDIQVIKRLLALGANPDARDNKGDSPRGSLIQMGIKV